MVATTRSKMNQTSSMAMIFFFVTILVYLVSITEAIKPFAILSEYKMASSRAVPVMLSKDEIRKSTKLLLMTRGGSDEYDSEEEDFSDDDDEDLFDDFEMGEDDEDDFGEDNTVDRMIMAYKATPPLTKAYLTASFLATASGYITKKDFPQIFVLDWQKVISRAQIWRPFTTFLNFGRFGLGYVMTVHFVWTYMSTLERLHHHKPYDFWIMIVFGMLSMVVGYPILKLSPRFLGHNLSTFLVYVWSRYHEGLEVNMFELFNTRAELLPWFFLAQVGLH